MAAATSTFLVVRGVAGRFAGVRGAAFVAPVPLDADLDAAALLAAVVRAAVVFAVVVRGVVVRARDAVVLGVVSPLAAAASSPAGFAAARLRVAAGFAAVDLAAVVFDAAVLEAAVVFAAAAVLGAAADFADVFAAVVRVVVRFTGVLAVGALEAAPVEPLVEAASSAPSCAAVCEVVREAVVARGVRGLVGFLSAGSGGVAEVTKQTYQEALTMPTEVTADGETEAV